MGCGESVYNFQEFGSSFPENVRLVPFGYFSHMDGAASCLSAALNQAVLRVVRALIKVAVRHGLDFPVFIELAKHAYVDVALNEFAIPGRKPTVSRAALLTGLSRKDVQRVIDEGGAGGGEAVLQENRAARVVSGWMRDHDFRSGDEPAALQLYGDDASFSTLVRRYSGDMPPRVVLDELIRVGAVQRDDDGRLRLQTRGYIPRASDAAKLDILGADVAYLISAIDHNLQGLEPSRFQRKVMYDNLPVEAMPEFRALSARLAQEVIERLDAWLADHDRDANPAVTGEGRTRGGLGIFAIEEELLFAIEEEIERPANEAGARTRGAPRLARRRLPVDRGDGK